jgi:hypothetical protein
VIDETRVSTAVRSSTWISTEYNNQNSPQTFYATTTEESNITSRYVDIKSIPEGNYKWQTMACSLGGCSNWTAFNVSTPNFSIDITAPVFINTFTRLASTTVSIKLGYPTAVTEANFQQYKIYYKIGSTTKIHESDFLIGSSTLADLGSRTFNGEASTTISGLATGTVYSFSLWAYDQAGNKSSSTLMWARTNRLPSAVFNSAALRTDRTGRADISIVANDADKDAQLMAKLEYVVGTTCHANTVMAKATLDETDANTTASYGDPKVQNKNTYQVGTSTGWITAASGANTVNFDWLTKTDLPAGDSVYCLRLTVNDNRGGYSLATTTIVVDNVAPTGLGSLTLSERAGISITPAFGAAAVESNFYQYKIFYKAGSSGVRESDSLFGSSSDAALGALN